MNIKNILKLKKWLESNNPIYFWQIQIFLTLKYPLFEDITIHLSFLKLSWGWPLVHPEQIILLCNVSNAVWRLWKVTYSCYTYYLKTIKCRLGIGWKIPILWISTDIYWYRSRYFKTSLLLCTQIFLKPCKKKINNNTQKYLNEHKIIMNPKCIYEKNSWIMKRNIIHTNFNIMINHAIFQWWRKI